MEYSIHENFLGKRIVSYKCPTCGADLESPLSEAGSMQECPFCHAGFYSPGVDEKKAEDRQTALEKLAKENAALAKRQQQAQHVEVRPAPRPPDLVWYGAMFCQSCGYRWKSRRQTPPAKCHNCGSRHIAAIREPRRSWLSLEGSGCLVMLLLFVAVPVITFFIFM